MARQLKRLLRESCRQTVLRRDKCTLVLPFHTAMLETVILGKHDRLGMGTSHTTVGRGGGEKAMKVRECYTCFP